MAATSIEQLTPRKLSKHFGGGSERWWTRYLPELHKLGRISKRGRLFFGDLSEVADWLAAGSAETANPDR
jgi:hypothetical protein